MSFWMEPAIVQQKERRKTHGKDMLISERLAIHDRVQQERYGSWGFLRECVVRLAKVKDGASLVAQGLAC